jgi:hypothetical protein
MQDPSQLGTEMAPWVAPVAVAVVALIVNGIVGLGVEGSKRTKIAGVFAAGWLTLMEGLGFLAVWGLDIFPHALALGVGFIAIGLGIVSLPVVHREFERATSSH